MNEEQYERPSQEKGSVGITCGIFDLCHAGHLMAFEWMRQRCDYLIVAVQVDASKYREGKQEPVETIFERTTRLKACKYVSEIIVYESEEDLETILSTVPYDTRFIGSDHESKSFTGDSIRVETHVFNPRPHKLSSTELRARIRKGRRHSFRKIKENPKNVKGKDLDDTRVDGYIRKRMIEDRKEDK